MLAGLTQSTPSKRPSRTRLGALFVAAVMAVPGIAAANDSCRMLRAELDRPARVIGNTAQVRQFANALTQQNIVIRRIRNDLRDYGCSSGSITVYGNPNARMCGEIEDALAQAEAERDMIAEDRDRTLATERGDDDGKRRRQIMAALDAEGCLDGQGPDFASTEPERYGSVRPYTDPFNDTPPGEGEDYAPSPDMPIEGGLRTLCVRTCDGAFFPISSNATPLDFKAQAAQCERMCPGTETELFYHAMVGQESDDMISAKTGKPYKDMPTAFAYRNGSAANRSSSCGCNMAAYHDEMRKQTEQASAPQSVPDSANGSITHIPSPAGDTQKTPQQPKLETKSEEKPVPERDYDPKAAGVRVVGPQFLPEETSRIDLKNPALKGLQPQQE